MAPTDPQVTAYGWELHNTSGNSDKFYRILVFVHPGEAGVMFLSGGRGQSPGTNQTPPATGLTPQQAADQAIKMLRSKANSSGYDMLTRDFTAFQVPVTLAAKATRDTPSSMSSICRLFRDAAFTSGAEYDEAAVIK